MTGPWQRLVDGTAVEPSIYAADFARLGAQLETLLDAGTRLFHFDVGDGHFVKEITIGPIVLKSVAPLVRARGGAFDCHLMVSEPERHFEPIREAGGESVTFHVEASGDPARTIARARELGLGVGVALNPETPVQAAVAAASEADLVLCMSVHPGLSGQKFIPESLDRIAELRRLLPDTTSIQSDGGVSLENVGELRAAGTDLFVVGSGIFWRDDPAGAYRELARAVA